MKGAERPAGDAEKDFDCSVVMAVFRTWFEMCGAGPHPDPSPPAQDDMRRKEWLRMT